MEIRGAAPAEQGWKRVGFDLEYNIPRSDPPGSPFNIAALGAQIRPLDDLENLRQVFSQPPSPYRFKSTQHRKGDLTAKAVRVIFPTFSSNTVNPLAIMLNVDWRPAETAT